MKKKTFSRVVELPNTTSEKNVHEQLFNYLLNADVLKGLAGWQTVIAPYFILTARQLEPWNVFWYLKITVITVYFFWILLFVRDVGRTVRKHVCGHMRTAKAQIRLRIRAVWSGPSLSANRIFSL